MLNVTNEFQNVVDCKLAGMGPYVNIFTTLMTFVYHFTLFLGKLLLSLTNAEFNVNIFTTLMTFVYHFTLFLGKLLLSLTNAEFKYTFFGK